MTNTPKTFTATFLPFLYFAVSSKSTPALDFAGWQMLATALVIASYSLAAFFMIGVALVVDRWKMMRDGN